MSFSCLICALNLTQNLLKKAKLALKFPRTPKSCSKLHKLSCLKLADNNLEKPTILLVWVDFIAIKGCTFIVGCLNLLLLLEMAFQ